MSDDLHQLSITGRLGRNAELRNAGGSSVLELSVAVNHRAKVDGQWKDVATWYRVQVWGKRGEALHKLGLCKGDRIAATGDHEPREYTGRDGKNRIIEELANATVYLMGNKREGGSPQRQTHTSGTVDDCLGPDPCGDGEDDAFASGADDDIPF